jgi:DNA repair protein RecO
MAHHYTTPAIILESRPQGELHRTVTLFTKEFGMLYGVARSARTQNSKLRGLLQKSFHGVVTLVRGKKEWKVVGAIEECNMFYTLRNFPEGQLLAARMHWLLARLVKGEEKNEHLYRIIESFSRYLVTHSNGVEQLPALERLTVLRVLSALGYATLESSFSPFLQEDEITENALQYMKQVQPLATREINRALEASHL